MINMIDNLKYEKELYEEGYSLIAGVDEVGRGPLVGPVLACAVILPVNYKLEGITDSKKLSEKKREELCEIIKKDAISIGIGIVSPREIDEINILEASKKAMKLAIEDLDIQPDYILIDATKLNLETPSLSIIKGDLKSISISAASIVAKVTRDKIMTDLGVKYPEYDYKNNKGYPTKKHLENIVKYGIHDEYRFTFKPISDLINKGGKNVL